MSDIKDNNANVDLKSLQMIGHGILNQSCHESVHLNSCNNLQKKSADYDSEHKERSLIKL